MVYVVKETNTKNGRESYQAVNSIDGRTHAIEQGARYPSYPDAMAAASVLAARDGTETFYYEAIEIV